MNGKEKNAVAIRKPKTMLDVNVMRLSGAWGRSLPGHQKLIAKWCSLALAKSSAESLSIVLANDAYIRELNHTYRGKDKATNVLSFEGDGDELGDIILGYETVKQEAKSQGKSFEQHLAHLVLHGCLHLLGHDHEKPQDAHKMEILEIKLLAGLGFSNPYEITI
jgi:probable rRNA maturation factor